MKVEEETWSNIRRDLRFKFNGRSFTIRSIPYHVEEINSSYMNSDVSSRVYMLKDLMIEGEIPSDIEFS